MLVELSPYELRTILNWSGSRQGFYGSCGTLATLREITLADRLSASLAEGVQGAPPPPDPRVVEIIQVEAFAARVLEEEIATAGDALAASAHEVVYAGIVHSLDRRDERYWSVADLQVEPIGAERPEYRFFTCDVPVWREGHPHLGAAGETLRSRIRAILGVWVGDLRAGREDPSH